MKYVPFVILGILAALGCVGVGQWDRYVFKPDVLTGFALFLMAVWAGILYWVQTLELDEKAFRQSQSLRNYISGLQGRIYELEKSGPSTAKQINQLVGERLARLEKSTVICMEQITDLDRRVSGNDPFGG